MGAVKDLHHAVRVLLREPRFALFCVLLLGVGIAANTAIFSIVNGVLLQALPYREPASSWADKWLREDPQFRRRFEEKRSRPWPTRLRTMPSRRSSTASRGRPLPGATRGGAGL